MNFYLNDDLDGEDCREEDIEVVEDSISRRIRPQRVFSGQHAGGDHDAGQDDVGEDRMIANHVTEFPAKIKGRCAFTMISYDSSSSSSHHHR